MLLKQLRCSTSADANKGTENVCEGKSGACFSTPNVSNLSSVGTRTLHPCSKGLLDSVQGYENAPRRGGCAPR